MCVICFCVRSSYCYNFTGAAIEGVDKQQEDQPGVPEVELIIPPGSPEPIAFVDQIAEVETHSDDLVEEIIHEPPDNGRNPPENPQNTPHVDKVSELFGNSL